MRVSYKFKLDQQQHEEIEKLCKLIGVNTDEFAKSATLQTAHDLIKKAIELANSNSSELANSGETVPTDGVTND